MEAPVGDPAAQTPACPGLASIAPLAVPASTSFELSLAPTGTDSLSRTLTHLQARPAGKGQTGSETDRPSQSNLSGGFEKELEAEVTLSNKDPKENILSALPQRRKSVLLLCFCLSMFIDVAGVSATFLMTTPIAADLNIKIADEAWIMGTYSLAFASTLLFAGRLADLYLPHRIYTIGFIGIAVLYLVISFLNDQYSFFVLRAISALFAVWTIPSSINMIVQMYPEPTEQAKKLALFGMAGAFANTLALVLAGIFLLASWRWYFRFIALLVAPFAVLAWFLMPRTEAVAEDLPGSEKWKRMDLGGVAIMIACLILFILGFTQVPINGWASATCIAPLVVSIVLLPIFFIWEQKMPRGYSLLPHNIWKYPNIFPIILHASANFLWFACAQLRMASYFQDALGDSPILAAVKLLPMGISALVVGAASQAMPWLINKPRFVQPVASMMCLAGSLLFAFSDGGHGSRYWSEILVGQVIGTAGAMVSYIGVNTSIIQAFPLEFAGMGGAVANVILQIGGVVGISVQAGLLGTGDGTIKDWTGSKNSYFFTGGYIAFTGLIFLIFYKPQKIPASRGPIPLV